MQWDNEHSKICLPLPGKLARCLENLQASVIVPTLNEAEAIGKVLADVRMVDMVSEVIVVDSSTDATAKIAESFGAKVIFESRKGYGRALQSGVEKAKGDIVVYIDGDYTYAARDIPRILEPILLGDYDVVLGSRINKKMQRGAMSLLNRFGNTLISLIFSFTFLKKVDDTQCGLRAIRKRFLENQSYRNYGMPYVTEQLIKLIKAGAKIANIPIIYRPRIGTTKLCTWTDGFKILKVIFRECFWSGNN